jgi:uncharacterized protein YeeX (DUF496 family)
MADGKISKGENSAQISLTLELLNIVKKHAGKEEQINGFWICKRWLTFDEEIKKEIIEKHGQEFYNELLAHYSKTNIQQRTERELEEQAKKIREEAKAKIEALKTMNPEQRKIQAEIEELSAIIANSKAKFPQTGLILKDTEEKEKHLAELKARIEG